MYASQAKDLIIDMIIISEASQTGFLDLSLPLNSFKAQLVDPSQVIMSKLVFSWNITDQNNVPIGSGLSVYNNSLSVNTSQLNSYTSYIVTV